MPRLDPQSTASLTQMLEWMLRLLPDSPSALRAIQLLGAIVTALILGLVALAVHKASLIAERDAGKTQKEAERLKSDLDVARAEQERLSRELEAEREKSKPRTLTNEQGATLVQVLSAYPEKGFNMRLNCIVGDTEARGYADQFLSVLRKAGWPVYFVDQNIGDANLRGLWILAEDPQKIPHLLIL